jgi:hypothetical protein
MIKKQNIRDKDNQQIIPTREKRYEHEEQKSITSPKSLFHFKF